MKRILQAAEVPEVDRPVSEKKLSGVGNFLGLYGGEHIAATEFVFGATLVTWGCPAKDIFLGLFIGNILAVLTFTFLCATIATSTRLTLYSYLKKILGSYAQKFYSLVWGICSTALAASGICVSATAIREVLGISIQREWYPTNAGFVAIVVVLGVIVTIVAANGFEAVAKFSSTCVPWMIIIFFIGALVALPQLANALGVSIHSFGDIWNILNSSVGSGSGMPGAENIGIGHVICFAWLCNLAWHAGLNDMGLFRFAKNYKYGYLSAIGMFVGHFFAWIMVAIMGAAAAAILKTSLNLLDPGAVTNTVFGMTGICAVIVAGWTTANPTIYRAALSINCLMPRFTRKQVTYMIGGLMTIAACFPAMTDIGSVVQILGWSVVGVGAICITEHYIFPKIGYTRFWSLYQEKNINWAAVMTWAVSIIFVFVTLRTGAMHRNFIFIPEYLISVVCYIVLAGLFGAKGNYAKEQAEEEKLQAELKDLVDRNAEEDIKKNESIVVKNAGLANVLRGISFAALAGILITAFMVFAGAMTITVFKTAAFILTIMYFVLNGTATYIKFKNEASVLN
ncbi:cytosine permease [Faecalicatena contorta]|uniref:cytosine permease n=1 Tax=Faecalicatena contorta TaxID=39482 RepID=UPI00129E1DF4|nr:cytosine permease [Faecalicatena contorta]MRM88544.1 cytosine permease [Faecalicatena contorta]